MGSAPARLSSAWVKRNLEAESNLKVSRTPRSGAEKFWHPAITIVYRHPRQDLRHSRGAH
jgi:hypothetical protein